MNKRDERGWRIPRKGTKNEQVYQLMIAGHKTGEIAKLLGKNRSTIGVLIFNIKNPAKHNARANIYYRKNRYTLNEKARTVYKRYSGRVVKLVNVLGISYTEAVEIERQELEKAR